LIAGYRQNSIIILSSRSDALTISNQQPAINNQQPATNNQQPATTNIFSMPSTLPADLTSAVLADLRTANLAYQNIYPGDSPQRQPVHTVYGGANLFTHDTAARMSQAALKVFRTYAPDAEVLAGLLGLEHELAGKVYPRVLRKLEQEAVEDFRIDFEDGFGNRSDAEEDAVAEQAAGEVAKGMELGTLPPFIGIRIKPFNEDLKARGLRTLDIFLTTLLEKTGGRLPENFIVMLPKVVIPEQIRAMVRLLEHFEKAFGLPARSLKMETMVEQTQAIMDAEGKNPLMSFIRASEGRCIAAHFGTYDYTASAGITAKYQTMGHPVCDFAHHMTKVALGNTGIMLSDGATNVMPIGPHRGENLTAQQQRENTEVVHRAWKTGFGHTMHSLINGLYQGWDLHPAQLPMRYAAVYAFFLDSYADAALRLRHFVEKAAQATLSGDIFDDAATGQGLLNYFLKALNCGAITEEEATVTGLSVEEIRLRSFYRILEQRRGAGSGF
jgi:citrate lyase beta subunit